MTKAELRARVDAMSEEEAAEVILVYAPDWPTKVTPIEEIRNRKGFSATSGGDSGSPPGDDQD